MTADLRFEFAADRANAMLTVTREFASGRQLVWDCHTKQDLLDRWFAPKGLTTRTSHMDFREGGYWHYAMIAPDGQQFWNRLDYRTIDPIDRYTATDGFCDEAGTVNPDMPRSDWTVAFADAPAGTLVTTLVRYASPDDLQKTIEMGMEGGMTSTMERLDELLAALASHWEAARATARDEAGHLARQLEAFAVRPVNPPRGIASTTCRFADTPYSPNVNRAAADVNKRPLPENG